MGKEKADAWVKKAIDHADKYSLPLKKKKKRKK